MNPIDFFDYRELPLGRSDAVDWFSRHCSGLEDFLFETWKNRPQSQSGFWAATNNSDGNSDDSDEDEIQSETEQPYLLKKGDRFEAGRFVGTIWYEGRTINIWPRVFQTKFETIKNKQDSTPEKQEPQVQGMRGLMTRNLLHWASRAGYFEGLNPGVADSAPASLQTFFDAYLWLFANHARKLVATQPYWQYQLQEEEGVVLRGRLLINPYIRDCLARGRWHRLVYEHEPFIFDNLLNQIIKRACRVARACTDADEVKELLDAIIFEMDEVEDVPRIAADCDRVHLNRMQAGYLEVLDACRMILAVAQADASGQTGRRFCFLLPMDRLFESYLRALATESLANTDWEMDNSQPYLIRNKDAKDAFQLKHDLFFKNKKDKCVKEQCVIADAKWKHRTRKAERNQANLGVTQGDMYQMIAYAYRRSCNNVHLLYPKMDLGTEEKTGEAKPIGTFKTWPHNEDENSGHAITIKVWDLKIHFEEASKTDEHGNTPEENAIKRAFQGMLDNSQKTNTTAATETQPATL